jgi:hypothetical protein
MPANHEDHITGLPEELLVAHEAIDAGWAVSFPFGGQARYDLVLERGGVVLKVQVKTAQAENGSSLIQKIVGLGDYEAHEVDFFAGVVDFSDVETEYPPCVDSPRHIFYKPYGDENQVGGNQGQIERVNYRQKTHYEIDSNYNKANKPDEYDFEAQIDPLAPW